jgi:NADH-quinone oxidoreductase subunit L
MKDHHGHPERGYERFFAFLALFLFSMCMLVLAGNFVLLYLGWELVGLCSYLLIGFYYAKPSAAAAAEKAFLVNRIGDFGFALGIFALYTFLQPHVQAGENPLDYATAFKYASLLTENQATLVALLLFCGAIGKSAQIPLYVWLPDAMEGPSPVSALIHAATMVTAGVYMVARCGPIYAESPLALEVVTIIGAVGAIFAATMALAQYDMKRILAYSTMSQLAYMFVGLGCAAPGSAIFHLYTHAFFKALLFLTAGNVMHAMGNRIDVREFSGLRRVLPTTYKLMGVGCLALAGFPLLAGFWSKDEIIHAAFYSEMGHHLPWLGWLMVLTSALTAFYTFRMFFLCFHGPERLPPEAGHPHDMPPVMQGPLFVLAAGAVLAGYAGVSLLPSSESFLGFLKPHGGFFHDYLHSSTLVEGPAHGGGMWLMYLSALVAIAGIALAYAVYGRAPERDPAKSALGSVWNLWNAKYYVDELYQALFVTPLRRLGDLCFATDRYGVDGLVWLVAAVPRAAGGLLRFMQGGALQGYALSMLIGLAVLVALWRWMDSPPM